MAYYTSAVKTWTIDPAFHTKQRSEFRLPSDLLFLPNIRVLNVGVNVDTANNRYNYLVGSQPIKNIWLYDGKQVLDQVVGFGPLEGFRRYFKTNSENMDVAKTLKCHGMGFYVSSTQPTSATNFPRAKVYEWNPLSPNVPQADESTPTSLIDLKEVFGLLNQIQFLSTTMFKELRVVIEYDLSNILDATSTTSHVITVTQPLLVADELQSEQAHSKFLSEFKSCLYNSWETESVQLKESQSTGLFKLNGFSNKTIGRFLLQKQGGSETSLLYRSYGSEAMMGEQVQFVIDGVNWLPQEGLTKPNERLGMLTDTFGICNSYLCSNDTACYKITELVDATADRVGHLDYSAVKIGERIKNMQLSYKRLIRLGASTRYTQRLVLNVFGEVGKAIVKSPSVGYQVIYV